MISKCELFFFSYFQMNMNAGTCWSWLFLAHFTTLFRMVTKYFCKTDILSMASLGKRNQGRTWTAFCSLFCMPELLPKVGVLLACFFDRYKNFKFINWYLDGTIEYKYNVQCFCLKRTLNIIIQADIFREYRNKCFWRPKCFGKAIPQIMTLRILSGKGAVQIMPLWKLGGKFHFFLQFCTRKWSKTYIY